MPPHLHKHERLPVSIHLDYRLRSLIVSVLVGSLIAFLIAFTLLLFTIPIIVVLPTTAPIFVGGITLCYMMQN